MYGLILLSCVIVFSQGTFAICTDGTATYANCSSEGYNYVKCEISGVKRINDVSVVTQFDREPGKLFVACKDGNGRNYGFRDTFIWVDYGCRATFEVCAVFRSTTSITTPTIITQSVQTLTTPSTLTTGSNPLVTARTAVLQAVNQYDESRIKSLETKFITVAVIGAFVLLALIILLAWLILCRGVCHRVSPSEAERRTSETAKENNGNADGSLKTEDLFSAQKVSDMPYGTKFDTKKKGNYLNSL